MAVDTGVTRVYQRGKLKPALALHLLVYTHLLLRVTDVEVSIARLHTVSELARIVNRRVTGTTALGRHHNHTGHSLGTVYRRRTSVFQNLERLNVVSVQACYSTRYQRHSVATTQVIGINLNVVLQNHAVHNPQRTRTSVNRCRAANSYLWRCSESSGHVLNRHTGSTTLKSATHVGHSV